jgi:hypothetical protein
MTQFHAQNQERDEIGDSLDELSALEFPAIDRYNSEPTVLDGRPLILGPSVLLIFARIPLRVLLSKSSQPMTFIPGSKVGH